jgi:formylglycine-generating enzyme required for sulfatase activity
METRGVVHPSVEALRALALGKLDDNTASAVLSHLDICPECSREVAAATNDDFLNRLRNVHQRGSTLAPAESLAETPRRPHLPTGPTTLYNVPPELADHPEYDVLRELGRGGMGVVYQARHKLSGRVEVLKVMSKELLERPESRERFLREIQSAARLDHRNVVRMYTALERGNLMVLVMEYVEGEDLAQVVKARGPLSVLNACYYTQQAALGLQHAFEKGMIHRDIKPQNLMLAREGKKHIVKILDFGLAKATQGADVDAGLTGTGAMMGTPGYVAPEQSLDAAAVDIRADIYSLGCTLYHLLAGNPPFSGKSAFEIMQAHHLKEAAPLNRVRPEISQEVAVVVRKMMAKEPAQRYQTPAEVVQALGIAGKQAAKGSPKSSPDVATPTAKARTEEEKRLLRAETILPSPQAAQETMLRHEGRPVGAGNILSAKTILPDQARQARDGRKPRPTAGNKKGLDWIIGAAAAGIVLVLGGVLIWGMYSKRPSKNTPSKPDEQQVRAEPKEPVIPSDEKKSLPPTEKRKSDDPPTPPDNNRPPRPATETAETRLVAKVKEVAGMDLVRIPAGEFYMGSEKGDTDAYDNEKPRHKVRISGPFWLGKYKVTVGQFKRFVGATNYETEAEKAKDKWTWRKPGYSDTGFDQTDEHPVVCVSWNDARAYCAWVAEKTGAKVRLPREAEWEYSCRARSTTKDWVTTKYYFGDNVADLGDYAWYADNAKPYGTRPCGQKKPNAFGLYDMHGLAWEWCDDGKRTYSDDAESDPVGAGASRVIRGGSFNFDPRYCRAALRFDDAPSNRFGILGFRVLVSR